MQNPHLLWSVCGGGIGTFLLSLEHMEVSRWPHAASPLAYMGHSSVLRAPVEGIESLSAASRYPADRVG